MIMPDTINGADMMDTPMIINNEKAIAMKEVRMMITVPATLSIIRCQPLQCQ